MMGAHILYYRGKIIGGIYDDRLLVKPVRSAVSCMSDPKFAFPYTGAKEMLLVEDVDNRESLCSSLSAMREDLPSPKSVFSRSWCQRVLFPRRCWVFGLGINVTTQARNLRERQFEFVEMKL